MEEEQMKQPRVVARKSKSKPKKEKKVMDKDKKDKKDKPKKSKKSKKDKMPPVPSVVVQQPPLIQAPKPEPKKSEFIQIDTKHHRIPHIKSQYGLDKTQESNPYRLTPEFQPKDPVSEKPFITNPHSGQPSEIGVQHDYSQTLHQHHGEVGQSWNTPQFHHHSRSNKLEAGVLQELWEHPVQRNVNLKPMEGPSLKPIEVPHTALPKPPEGYNPNPTISFGPNNDRGSVFNLFGFPSLPIK